MLEPLEEEIRTLHAILGSDRDPDGRAFAPLADAYRRAGQPRKAFGLLTGGLSRLPDFASGHVVAARLYAEQGLFAEGELAARRALDLDPDNVIALAALVRVLESLGKTEAAEEARTTLRLLEPEVLVEEGLVGPDPEAEESSPAAEGQDGPVMDLAELAPEEAEIDVAALAPDEPVMDLAELAPEEPVMDLAELAPEEVEVDVAALAPDEPVMDLANLAPEESVLAGAAVTASGRDSGGNPSGSASGPAPRIYTRTLGELYARQGFLDRAVDVFRQLRAEHPEDTGLAERLAELEGQLAGDSGGHAARKADRAEDAPKAERARERDEELESLARDLAGQRREEPSVDTPFAWAGSDDQEDPSERSDEGPSIESYFEELLSWTPKGRA